MLKLTKCHWDKDQIIPGQPVWIAPQHVQSINVITVAAGVLIIESPEEIMAMPEMAYAMYPVMTIPTRAQAEDLTQRSA